MKIECTVEELKELIKKIPSTSVVVDGSKSENFTKLDLCIKGTVMHSEL